MKLVIDPEHVGQCVMQVGLVELPLSREQVVQMLFGDAYELVPRKTGRAKSGRAGGLARAKKAKRLGRPPKVCRARGCHQRPAKGKKYCEGHLAHRAKARAKTMGRELNGAAAH